MKVRITPEGEAQLAIRRKWWRQNRSKAPDLFDEELAAAIGRIAQAPESFPTFAERKGRTIRRCLMKRTRCQLYIETDTSAGVVWLLAAGGGQRRRPPRIQLRTPP
jgi:hypothetical protein